MRELAPYPPLDGTEPCLQADPEAFFPKKDSGNDWRTAVKVCLGCDLIDECLSYALDHNEPGIWGGTTYNERIKILAGAAPRRKVPPIHIDGTTRERVNALDNGQRTARQVAELAGCTRRTVERYRAERRAAASQQEGHAA